MYKKVISLLLIFSLLTSFPFIVSAADISFDVIISDPTGSGTATVTVTLGSQTQTFTSSGRAEFTSEGSNKVTVSVSGVPSNAYPTIDGETTTSKSYSSLPQSVSVSIVVIPSPSITLSPNNDEGGINYSISGAGHVGVAGYDLRIYEAGAYKTTIQVQSSSGTLSLGSVISAGKSYTIDACIRVSINGNSGAFGSSATVTAAAAPVKYSLSAKATPGGTVSGSIDGFYAKDVKVNLMATAEAGYKFAGWESDAGGSFDDEKVADTIFTMPSADVTLTANFLKTHKFVIMSSTGGKVWDVDGDYYEGETVWVSAIPGDGYVFDSWVSSDGGKFTDSKAVATNFTMPGNSTTVTATFKESSGSSSQTNPDGTDGPEDDTGMFEIRTRTSDGGTIVINQNRAHENQKITIRANAKAGFVFDGWSSEGGGEFADIKAASTTFIMPADNVTIIANFIPGESSTAQGTDNQDAKKEDKPDSSVSIWLILAGAGALLAVGAGVLLILNERKKRRYEDDFDENGNPDSDNYIHEYEENDQDVSYDEGEEDSGDEDRYDGSRDANNRNGWRRKPPRRRSSPNTFHADDWEE